MSGIQSRTQIGAETGAETGTITEGARPMMTAAVLYGREDIRMERQPIPVAGPGELVVRVGAALTCGTDLKVYRRGYHARMLKPPARFGHELAGVVAEVGCGVTGFAVGDRVVALNSAPCGQCYYCLRDQENLCDDLLFLNGAYAEFLAIPARIAQKNTLLVPDHIPFEHAAMTEPLACALHGWEDSNPRAGDTVAVIGGGPLGLMMMRLAALADCQVIAVVKREAQAQTALALGARQIVLTQRVENVVEAVRTLTPHARGVDIAIEAVALAETWEQAVAMARKGGTVNFFGGPASGTQVSLDTNRLHYNDLTLKATFHHTPAICRRALELIVSGRFQPMPFLTGHAALAEIPQVFAQMLHRGEFQSPSIKTAILP